MVASGGSSSGSSDNKDIECDLNVQIDLIQQNAALSQENEQLQDFANAFAFGNGIF